ncbi:MAG TPA: hypothetical protein VJZ04_06595 [Lachnospiraceae bacterium]|nr:hypothetical protein [Lachnospiraceae bacterium]
MAKKFVKFLLFTTTVATAVAGAYVYMQNKKSKMDDEADDLDDFDDFSDDLDSDISDSKDPSARTYVSLNHESVAESIADISSDSVEKVEEFFDDEDSTTTTI